ncbi:MAG TPA: L-type lectin-domain containing protein [Solirubrobacterales bacterium]|nr:L-type lectin-domain containing protein [Solirubrobacterales bacterium]
MHRRLTGIALSLFASLALAAPAGAATLFDYPDFSNTAGLTLNGSAAQTGNVLRLTPPEGNKAGSAFGTAPIDPQQTWQTQFQLHMHDETFVPGDPADGIAFVIQSEGLGGGSGLGGSLGYGNVKPSVAVEFDIFYNEVGGDPVGDHVSILSEGDTTKHLQCASEGAPNGPCTAALPFPIYGSPVHAWVEYDATTQRLKVFLGQTASKPAAPLLDHQISFAPVGSSAYAGFTAATGAHNATQDVLSWQFGRPDPATVPAPAAGPVKKKGKRCGKKAKGKGKKASGKKAGASKAKGKAKGKGKKPKCGKKKGKAKAKGKKSKN